MNAGRSLIAVVATAVLVAGCGGGGGDDSKDVSTGPSPIARPEQMGSNVARVGGLSPTDVAAAAVLAAYPGEDRQPNGIVLTRLDRWREAMLGAQFAADPVFAALLPIKRDYLPTAAADLVQRLHLRGFPRAKGLKAVVLGEASGDVFGILQEHDLELTALKAKTPPQLALDLVPFRGGWSASYSDQIVLVSSQRRDYALPAAAWSAYSGDTLTFVGRDSIPDATRELLVQRKKLRLNTPTIYLMGPPSAISEQVERELSQYGRVVRIAGGSPQETSIALARHHDAATGFGWGLDSGRANVSFVNPRDWGNIVGAMNFAANGPRAAVLLTAPDGSLTPQLRAYVRKLKNPQGSQAFVFGDERSIPAATLQEVDRLLGDAPAGPAANEES